MRIFFFIYLLLTLIGPLTLALSGRFSFTADYRTANRESAQIAPDPATHPEAIVQIYAARAFNWRGIFATHTWIATKPKDANEFTVYQVIGWRLFRGLPPVVIMKDIPDRLWFNQKPTVIFDLRGDAAEKIIPHIEQGAKEYPFKNKYVTWPGPNSNTFIAYLAREVPELHFPLPSNALGKDFLPLSQWIAKAPSGTGYQLSLLGLFGITIAKMEGLEINILGLVYGISPWMMTIKLPGFGDIKLRE